MKYLAHISNKFEKYMFSVKNYSKKLQKLKKIKKISFFANHSKEFLLVIFDFEFLNNKICFLVFLFCFFFLGE